MVAAQKPSPLYVLGLFLVTVAMLLLPCIYAGLTAAVCWGVYYFAVNDFPAIWQWHVGNSKYGLLLKVVCSVTPLLVGGAVALFMVKPLFARRPKRMEPLTLDPQMEPRVFELVLSVCHLLSAPAPSKILLDCEINASAQFDRGWRGFFGNKLILTLGLPLVAGLTQRELAGVIAHEFGHFRQGAGMRLSYVIRRVNGWFARVVYERDRWDEAIESYSVSEDGWVGFMVRCAQCGVWLSRRVLWMLMITGHAICAMLLRQMEFDADAAEVRVAGSDAFESTTMKLASLGAVMGGIHKDMRRSWNKQFQLPDNLPVLLAHRVADLPEEKRQKIENAVGLEKTRLLDTHPSAADRVRAARQMGEAGFDISDEPARDLFENFDAVSRMVTLVHYEDDLNVPTNPEFLIPTAHLIAPKPTPSTVAPAASATPAVPMMGYDPTAFQKKVDRG